MNKSEPLLIRLAKVLSLLLIALSVSFFYETASRYFKIFNIIYLTDTQAIPLESLSKLDVLDPHLLAKGREEMSKHRVTIAGITRDNAADSPVMMRHIEHIGGLFADYLVILFENDSRDGTQAILHDWETKNNKVHIISKNYNNQKRAGLQFLADARNHYLETIKSDPKYKDFDILMVVDMDMKYGIDIRGIEDSFAQIDRWDGVRSNGISDEAGHMFDMFAFRELVAPLKPEVEADQYLWGKVPVPGKRKVYEANSGLLEVDSCFGGMAFYKMKAIEGCLYDGGDCEHVAFHECMRTRNGARLFMNPAQMLRYSHFRE